MLKRIVAVLLMALFVGQAEMEAQSFLKELGKELGKTAKKAVNDVKKEAAQKRKPEERKVNMPPAGHSALFEPLEYPTTAGTLEWVCPEPPHPSKNLDSWAEDLKPVTELTNESLVREMQLLEPKLERSKYIINAIIGRYDAAEGELFARAGAIDDMVEDYMDLMDPTRNEAQRVNPALMLARTLGLDHYKRALNSSLMPLKPYLNNASLKYFDEHGGLENAYKAVRTKWEPFQEEKQVSTDGAAVGKLSPDGKTVDVDGLKFRIYLKTADGDFFRLIEVNKQAMEGKDVAIPAGIMYKGKSYPVTEIGSSAFFGAGVKSITIPNTVRKIERSAFGSLPYVKSIEIPSSVKQIGDFCFSKCAELAEIKVPDSVTKIGSFAFSECPKLTAAVLPKNLKSMGEQTFKSCAMLKNVTLPENLEKIPDRFFSGCKSLTSVNIPQTVKTIGYAAFENCLGLTSMTLPNSLVSIEGEAFKNCSKLTSLNIPASVKEIDTMTVKGCKALKTITMNKSYNDFYVLVKIFGGCEIFPESYYSTAKIPAAFKFVD